MQETMGLNHLKTPGCDGVLCPSCGNYLSVVANGFFHGQVFYCKKEKQTYVIKVIKQKANKEFLEQCEKDIMWQEIRSSITYKNMEKVKKLLEADH